MYFGVFLLGLIREILLKRRDLVASTTSRVIAPPHSFLLPLALIGMPVLFAAQLWTVAFMAAHQPGAACWSKLPIPVVTDFSEDSGGAAQISPSFILIAVACMQAALLLFIHKTLQKATLSIFTRILLGCVCITGITQAIAAPAITSSDVYSYISYAKLGFASYVAQPYTASPAYLPVEHWCKTRLFPAAYGPAFIFYLKTLLAFPHLSPVAKIMLLRASNAVWLIALVFLLRAAGASEATVAVAALNPALLFQYIANAHNDIIAVTLVIGGIFLAARSPIAAFIACITAGLVKIPFLVVGAIIFTQLSSRKARFLVAALAATASLIISYATAGPRYFEGLSYYFRVPSLGVPTITVRPFAC